MAECLPSIPAGSTIRQNPDGSWQYQRRNVGPWLSMPAPQSEIQTKAPLPPPPSTMITDPCSLYRGFKRINEKGCNAQVDSFLYTVDDVDEFFKAVWIVIKLPHRMTRNEYESECHRLNVAPLDDANTLKYIRGNYDLGTYFATADLRQQKGIPFTLHQIRAYSLADEVLDAAKDVVTTVVEVPAPEGELWEKCSSCGAEPVHMPLHLCRKCWPSTPTNWKNPND